MLTGITLENFKAFREPQYIPIKPITLVFGPNNAGKSSIIHALAFLKHVHQSGGDCNPGTVSYGGTSIHLGEWKDIVHGFDTSRTIRICLHFEKCSIGWNFEKSEKFPQASAFEFHVGGKGSKKGELVARGRNQVHEYQKSAGFSWDIEILSTFSYWDRFKEKLWASVERHLSGNHNNSLEHCKNLYEEAFKAVCSGAWVKVPGRENDGNPDHDESLFPDLQNFTRTNDFVDDTKINEVIYTNSDSTVRPILGSDLIAECFQTKNIEGEEPSFDIAKKGIKKSLQYSRTYPIFNDLTIYGNEYIRDMFPSQNDNPVIDPIHMGAFRQIPAVPLTETNMSQHKELAFWKTIYDDMNLDLMGINKSLSDLGLNIRIATKITESKSTYKIYDTGHLFTSSGSAVIDEGTYTSSGDDEIVFLDQNNNALPINALGSGIGVMLPIISLLSVKSKTFASIEEPECHIHPRLQAAIGDIVIESSLGKVSYRSEHSFYDQDDSYYALCDYSSERDDYENRKTVKYIETHSEHLILRILRRIRETTNEGVSEWPESLKSTCPEGLSADDVSVCYVEPEQGASVVKRLRINDLGEFIDEWPDGFFEDRINEIFG